MRIAVPKEITQPSSEQWSPSLTQSEVDAKLAELRFLCFFLTCVEIRLSRDTKGRIPMTYRELSHVFENPSISRATGGSTFQ